MVRQPALDLGPETHFDLLHGGHHHKVSLVVIQGGDDWQEKIYEHPEARAAATEYVQLSLLENIDAFISCSAFREWRNTRNVAAIPSLFVDFDPPRDSNPRITPHALLHKVTAALPWLPLPTILASSGRGAYFIWVLDRPLTNPERDLPRWQIVERELVEKLRQFDADPAVKDVTRVLRLPDSINTKSNTQVRHWQIANPIKFREFERIILENCSPPVPVAPITMLPRRDLVLTLPALPTNPQ